MSYYIKDTIQNRVVFHDDLNSVIMHLERLCQQKFNQTRKTYMNEMVSLGHGYDDPPGAYFTQMMSEVFEIGVSRKDGSLVRSNVHEYTRNVKYRNELGD